jgi:hypothetical protein
MEDLEQKKKDFIREFAMRMAVARGAQSWNMVPNEGTVELAIKNARLLAKIFEKEGLI